jgi:CshA-type fibril repeat protein
MRSRVLVAALVVLATTGSQAWAYQVPSDTFTQGTDTATGTMPGSGLTQTITTGGRTTTMAAATAGSRGGNADTYAPPVASGTPAEDLRVATGDCPSTGTCADRGTVTISFSRPVTNPVLHLAGLGAVATQLTGDAVTRQSELHSVLTLATPGVTLTKLSTGNNLRVTGTTITAADHDTAGACTSRLNGPNTLPSRATAACGSVRIDGTVTSVRFAVTAVFTKNPSVPAYNSPNSGDAFSLVASVGEDFGDAPSSYDGNDAARAVLSDLRLGAAVSEDNASTANATSSPNADPGADRDRADDGVALTPLVSVAETYSAEVAIGGASEPGAVCGWIDLDRSGGFDESERACAPVVPGQAVAVLTWRIPDGLSPGSTYARFRIGYAGELEPSGAADAGEVEDHPFTIVPPPPPVARPDTGSTAQNTDVTVHPLANDSAAPGVTLDPDSVLLFDPADGVGKKTVTVPGEGTYQASGKGSVAFDPVPSFAGTGSKVGYQVTDSSGQSGRSAITIAVRPVTPRAVSDTRTTRFETPVTIAVLANDSPGAPDAPLVPDSVCLLDGGTCVKTLTVRGEGAYRVGPDGSVTFTPADGYHGTTTLVTYNVADSNGTKAGATITVTVDRAQASSDRSGTPPSFSGLRSR